MAKPESKSTTRSLLPDITNKAFPPKPDFSSLGLRDVLEARDAYHIYLSSLQNVVGTAAGRYRIRIKDMAAGAAGRGKSARKHDVRTLSNSITRPWSWPCVMVFVDRWETAKKLGDQMVPRVLYLPDSRIIPTCVVQVLPDPSPPPEILGTSPASPLLGGGYPCLREHQGESKLGTFACLVYREGSYYALTNRHVAGGAGEEILAHVHGGYHRVGVTSGIGITKKPLREIFPAWPGEKTNCRLDAGLVLIDTIDNWTSQAFGIGELGEIFDATEQTVTLDMIGLPVRAFGGTSGVIEGEIQALFYRYASLGGYEDTTDLLIGPRTPAEGEAGQEKEAGGRKAPSPPLTRPGDSGTLWFYDPPSEKKTKSDSDDGDSLPPPDRGARARILRPLAMQWGAERFLESDGKTVSAYALGSFLSSICRGLEVDLVRTWSTGHDEYWGKLAHFAIGWKACEQPLPGRLLKLMKDNQERIGFNNKKLGEGSKFSLGRDAFVPLADVPDYVFIKTRPGSEGEQHFADIDFMDIHGGDPLLDRCHADPRLISAKVWKEFFDGYAAAQVGPEEGVLPFRIWQIWEAMTRYAKDRDPLRFVAAAGILSHYVGDATQRLHCSYLHHGDPPKVTYEQRKYPAPRSSEEYKTFQDSPQYKIHAIYDEMVMEIDTPALLNDVDSRLTARRAAGRGIRSGHQAAAETLKIMHAAHASLPPKKILDADPVDKTPKERAKALWGNAAIRRETVKSLAVGVRFLAALWSSAWKAGRGDSIPSEKIRTFSESDLEEIYRGEKNFIRSLSLKAMSKSGEFEPK